jgi:hypothetical protein
MTKEQKVIKAKIGVLEKAQAVGQCEPGLSGDGL